MPSRSMSRRRRSRNPPSVMPSKPHPAVCAVLALPALVFLLVNVYYKLRPSDDALCDTAAANLHPSLCGTSRRVCSDDPSQRTAPRPLVVVAAGPSRAASTWLYNALRILMRMRDPNTVAGWHADLHALYDAYARPMSRPEAQDDAAVAAAARQQTGAVASGVDEGAGANQRGLEGASRAEAFRSLGSVLVKLHLVQEWHEFVGGGDANTSMAGVVDAVFTTHRDVRDVVRSVRDMGWGVKASAERLAHPDFCMRRELKEAPRFLKSHHYANASTWVNLAHVHLVCRAALVASAGDKLKMDLRAESLRGLDFGGTVRVLRALGAHLDYRYSEAELEVAAKEMGALRPPPCDAGFHVEMGLNPVTHLHKGHVHFDKSATAETMDRRGMAAITQDEGCAQWLRQHSYHV